MTVCGIIILSAAVYYGIGWTKTCSARRRAGSLGAVLLVAYLGLLRQGAPSRPAARRSDQGHHQGAGLLRDRAHRPAFPAAGHRADLVPDGRGNVARPVGLLGRDRSWRHRADAAAADRASSAARATSPARCAKASDDLIDGLRAGARNMTSVGIATATAGIIVGTVSLTGIGLVMTEIVEFVSGGNLIIMLLLVGGDLPHPRHGHADHGELRRRRDADGAGAGRAGGPERSRRAADRGAHVRLLFRPDGRRDAAGRPRRLRGGGDFRRRSDEDRHAGHPGTRSAPRCCRSSSSSTPKCC